MALKEYKKKRSFSSTPEPTGGKPTDNQLQFVIQKHDASRLHYDFRLEMKGVLKSWAVPKGPSLNPSDKRLAMLVEDHPFDYKNFEGIIPEGNYGAGTVIIWDEGTFESLEDVNTKEEHEKILLKGFHAGQIKFRMHGKKLKGEFVLVKTPKRADNAWLLIKHRDEFASEEDITAEDRSVRSGKTIEDMGADVNALEWKSNRAASTSTRNKAKKKLTPVNRQRSTLKKKTSQQQVEEPQEEVSKILDSLNKSNTKMPQDIKPMLATLVNKPADDNGWMYEVKWDGYRALAYVGDEIEIKSRNNKSFNEKFYPIFNALKDWNMKAVVDGEIVVMNNKGFPDFGALQTWRSEADGELVYFLFDLLWLNGVNLIDAPFKVRRRLLELISPKNGIIKLSENFAISGSEFFALADKMGLEGIVAKKEDSLYLPDVRSKEWLKIKTSKQQEVIIAGYTRNENTTKLFSALLLGLYENGKLVFVGPVGTGFTTKMQEEILKKLKPLETSVCPFEEVPEYNKPSRFRPNPPMAEVTWVKPEVVAEVTYRTLASDGSFRHPSFKGLREDKSAKDIVREERIPVAPALEESETRVLKGKGLGKSKKGERKTLLNPKDETQVRIIEGHELKFPNLSKVYWPDEGYTKRDMLNYYYQVAPYMLPYFKDRPQTLNRFPNGIKGKSFYQKDVTGKVPDWIEKYKYYSEADQREKNFLVCSNEASLLYIASLGCIEMNPWSSRTQHPDHPDWCIIDLDPDKNSFEQVIQVAQVTKQVLDAIGVPSYCKTSGSTGLHIYIPFGAKYTYEDSKEFGRAVTRIIQKQLPRFTSVERLTSNRKGMIYLDFLQNRPQATVAGPYSLRPKPGAPVSMPLHWEEVKKGLQITDFNISNAVARLREHGDIFKPVIGEGIDLAKALKRLKDVF
ncbi:DNA ligase D [Chryseosolibacter indicus]|uniref:DNA ligase (ATP) n=1 Tax=Chryseosolibacter indicus TaxID=2782351 RepID=A0ABS5VJS0_9BACT|nr:DNA ligase D [Chryseosolibacter indicus]MBT1701683.1 DNA ligase D [Chryseosolibacter indicus]